METKLGTPMLKDESHEPENRNLDDSKSNKVLVTMFKGLNYGYWNVMEQMPNGEKVYFFFNFKLVCNNCT